MRQRMRNYLHVTVNGVDLATVKNIEFYLRQGNVFFQYTPEVLSSGEMLVEIPLADAKKLSHGECSLQFAFTDENGTPRATDPKKVLVGVLLKEAGYAGI